MKWLFSQDLFKTQQAFRCDVSTLILWCLTTTTSQRDVPFSNLSNFKAEILSGSFDSRHLSSTTAVHEGKAILYSQIFTVVTWTAMQFFGFWARLSITNPYVLHPAAEACLSMLTGMNPIFVAFFSCLWEKKMIFVFLFQWQTPYATQFKTNPPIISAAGDGFALFFHPDSQSGSCPRHLCKSKQVSNYCLI